jgi:ATP-dependent 26S proteasome regulatory subunit
MDKLLEDLSIPNSVLNRNLKISISNMMLHKYFLYNDKFKKINIDIIDNLQQQALTFSCSNNLIHSVINFIHKKTGIPWSMNILTGDTINLETGTMMRYATGNEYSKFVENNVSNLDKKLFHASSQCAGKLSFLSLGSETKKKETKKKDEDEDEEKDEEYVDLEERKKETSKDKTAREKKEKAEKIKKEKKEKSDADKANKKVMSTISGIDPVYPEWDSIKENNINYFNAIEQRNDLILLVNRIKLNLKGILNKKTLDEVISTKVIIYDQINDDEITKRINNLLNAIKEKTFYQSIKKGPARENIRNSIAKIIKSFSVDWKQFTTQYMNIVLEGPPGSGKTTIAVGIGNIFKELGILVNGTLKIHSRATMVGQYIGETALKVNKILNNNLEGIIFIDEAYAIAQGSGNEYDPYGVEALNEIVGFLDKHRGQICLISVGYKCEMEKFWFSPNPGLRRRTPYVWDLPSFNSAELLLIFESFLSQSNVYYDIAENPNVFEYFLKKVFIALRTYFNNEAGDMEILAKNYYLLSYFENERAKINNDDIFKLMLSYILSKNGTINTYDNDCNVIKIIRLSDVSIFNILEKIMNSLNIKITPIEIKENEEVNEEDMVWGNINTNIKNNNYEGQMRLNEGLLNEVQEKQKPYKRLRRRKRRRIGEDEDEDEDEEEDELTTKLKQAVMF